MFLGHFGVGFAAKRLAPNTCLGWLLAGGAALDLLWPVFLLADLEHVVVAPGITLVTPLDFYDYPWTHSLVTAVGWGALIGGLYYAINRYVRGALVIGVLVVSHWFLDVLVHRPDLPVYPGGPLAGLSLWNSLPATLTLEALVFGGGVWLYTRFTRPKSRAGSYALWAFVIFFPVIWLGSLFAPPPPTQRAIAMAGLAQLLILPWGWWIDAKREPRTGTLPPG